MGVSRSSGCRRVGASTSAASALVVVPASVGNSASSVLSIHFSDKTWAELQYAGPYVRLAHEIGAHALKDAGTSNWKAESGPH